MAEAGKWISDDKDLWQVWRELQGVKECITAEADLLAGKSVLVLLDAIGAVKYTNNGMGQSVEMMAIMKRIFRLCVRKEISMWAEHLSGDKMKESGVDSLSQWGEFEVNARVFKSFDQHSGWGRFRGAKGYSVDLYAPPPSQQSMTGSVPVGVQWHARCSGR